MPDLHIAPTDRTPEVAFKTDIGHLRLAGESYPEDVTAFYRPIFAVLDAYLAELGAGSCRCELALLYFNSSSAKAIMMLLEKLDAAAAKGARVDVHWSYDEEDDTMQELGEEFGEDLEHATFHLEKFATG
jgi:hypothetical protein